MRPEEQIKSKVWIFTLVGKLACWRKPKVSRSNEKSLVKRWLIVSMGILKSPSRITLGDRAKRAVRSEEKSGKVRIWLGVRWTKATMMGIDPGSWVTVHYIDENGGTETGRTSFKRKMTKTC